ncbi:hypothetical protein HK097_011548 [Rhizophlyctis rosea]|uniref:Uncharacterized protein n=1 Tax=Rhizophlyctis rosea TaxID=64517 RepID=A0AAD5S997_9FUNG|nr:hypothetical protein HK097_011548 [Rhizophlyctis rosea]
MSTPNRHFHCMSLTKASGDIFRLHTLEGDWRDGGLGQFHGNPALFVTLPTSGDIPTIRSRCAYLQKLFIKYSSGIYEDLDGRSVGSYKRSLKVFGIPLEGVEWKGDGGKKKRDDVGEVEYDREDSWEYRYRRQRVDKDDPKYNKQAEEGYDEERGYGDDDDSERDPKVDVALMESTNTIATPCRAAYGVTFPILQPVGDTEEFELFKWFRGEEPEIFENPDHEEPITSAFEMLLVDCDGYVAGRWGSKTRLRKLEPYIGKAFEAIHDQSGIKVL